MLLFLNRSRPCPGCIPGFAGGICTLSSPELEVGTARTCYECTKRIAPKCCIDIHNAAADILRYTAFLKGSCGIKAKPYFSRHILQKHTAAVWMRSPSEIDERQAVSSQTQGLTRLDPRRWPSQTLISARSFTSKKLLSCSTRTTALRFPKTCLPDLKLIHRR